VKTGSRVLAGVTLGYKRGYLVSSVEMGGEADGQYVLLEDYEALYLQFASALHRVDAKFQTRRAFRESERTSKARPDTQGRTSWFGRFLDYLKAHSRL
jgi:hypothetical protein